MSPLIRLKSVVLPAPLGPMIARRSPGRHGEVHAVHRLDAAEVLAQAAGLERLRLLAAGRVRHKPSSHETHEARRQDHDHHDHDRAEEERPVHRPLPADQPLEDLEAEGAGQRAEERLHAAQQRDDQRLEGLGEVGEVGEDAAVVEGEEPAGHAREGARDDEGDQLVAAHVDADVAGAARVLAHRLERVAERRVDDGVQGQDAEGHDRQREVVVGGRRLEQARRPHVEQAVVAAGERLPLEDHGEDDLGEGQREHGEVRVGEPHDEEAEQQRARRRDDRRRRQRQQQRHAERA